MEIKPIDRLSVATIRSLLIDMINKSNSGHPGMALDITPAMYVLYKNHIVADPKNPNWVNRDRFVLSSGHTCALLYSMLHVTGYKVTMDDLKNFRQLHSKTPGHPEVGWTDGVDASAGPLGQGIGQAVGMAMAEAGIAASYPNGAEVMNHYTYCLCGDGCLEEGISQECISFAGLQKLNKLILIYDENVSTLDGPTSNSMNDDVAMRFKSVHWNVIDVPNGEDMAAIDDAIVEAKKSTDAPTVIILHTKIGYGTALEGKNKCHGSPLGKEIGDAAKANYGFVEPEFTVPAEVYDNMEDTFAARGAEAYAAYVEKRATWEKANPEAAVTLKNAFARNVAPYIAKLDEIEPEVNQATRNVSGKVVAKVAEAIPFTLGGSADVAASVKTEIKGDPGFGPATRNARNVNYGIREFGMATINNGILLHGGYITYGGSFLVFADYFKNAIRMAAIQHLPEIFLLSHDSVAVGEDGPTHEPIEQLASLRTTPNVRVYRPCDSRETIASWKCALEEKSHVSCLILSRQNLPLNENSSEAGVRKGGYTVLENENANVELIAAGSEVGLAVAIKPILEENGYKVKIVSMPCCEIFDEQDKAYKDSVLNLPRAKRVAIEMAHGATWYKYADHVISYDQYGVSAPANKAIEAIGFTADKIAARVLEELK